MTRDGGTDEDIAKKSKTFFHCLLDKENDKKKNRVMHSPTDQMMKVLLAVAALHLPRRTLRRGHRISGDEDDDDDDDHEKDMTDI